MLTDADSNLDISMIVSKTFDGMTDEHKSWLMASVMTDQMKMTKLISNNRDLVDWQNYIDGNTALHYAAKFGDCFLIRLLAGDHHADVNKRNFAGLTPLHMAAKGAHKKAVSLLTSIYGANISIRDHSGRLPSAYLPKNVVDEEIKRYLKYSDRLLLSDQNMLALSCLYLKPEKISVGRTRSSSSSPIRLDPALSSAHSHVPMNTQFPWKSSSLRTPIESRSLSRRETRFNKSRKSMLISNESGSIGKSLRKRETIRIDQQMIAPRPSNCPRIDQGNALFKEVTNFVQRKHGTYQEKYDEDSSEELLSKVSVRGTDSISNRFRRSIASLAIPRMDHKLIRRHSSFQITF